MTAFPSVRDQAKRWTTDRSGKDADAPRRETFAARQVRVLGRLGRSTFATLPDHRELKLRGPLMPHELERLPDDAILVTRPSRDSQGRVRTDVFAGRPVEAGTFERLQRQKSYTPRKRQPGPLDGLAELRKPADRVTLPLGSDDDSPMGIIRGAMSRKPMLLMTDSEPVPMTVRRLVEVVNAAGGNLRRHGDRTLADWTHVRRWRPLLIAAWPLVDAHLAGKPLACAYEHEGTAQVADTLDPAGVPVCNRHVGEPFG